MNNYKTSQRKTIMDYLIDNKDKFVNAEEVLEYLKKNRQEVGLTTIYRFLNLLEKNGDVRIETREHTKYYQYVPSDDNNHLFLKCKNCGKSMNLDCKDFEDLNEHIIKEHKFNLDHNTIIYGTCDNCSTEGELQNEN